MKDFSYRVRGELSPYGRQRVYFACHPDDFELAFAEISQTVWRKFDCAIWYFPEEAEDLYEYTLRLREMQLLIIPITDSFLLRPNRARELDLPYALQFGIPVLPLMLAEGREELFDRLCGHIHFIDRRACDVTTQTWEQKIWRFMSRILVDDEQREMIRRAFWPRLFLSYRKKDRMLAQRLMTRIHDIPDWRDVAIWYDEYLLPGKDFMDAISDAMKSSKLFLLCVTENLINEDNFVRQTEYPEARRLAMPVLPVIMDEMTEEQLRTLGKMYKAIPAGIGYDDLGQALAGLTGPLIGEAALRRQEEPRHLYLVGLAYLNGIEVETDHGRARVLLTQAAGGGYIPAVEKLAGMYRIGEGVPRDPEKALAMYEKLISLLENGGDVQKRYDALHDALAFLLEASSFFRFLHVDSIKACTMKIAAAAGDVSLSALERFRLCSLLAFVNSFDDVVSGLFVGQALQLLPELYEDEEQAIVEEAVFFSRLARLYYEKHAGSIAVMVSRDEAHRHRREEAEGYICRAVELNERLYRLDPVRWQYHYAESLRTYCMMNYTSQFASDEALVGAMERAVQLFRGLCDENEAFYADKLAALCLASGDYLAMELDYSWEDELGVHLDLGTEAFVPGMPEQEIPLDTVIDAGDGALDIRRMRKALSLMRYSTVLYARCRSMGQYDCLADAVNAHHCLALLLTCLADDIGDEEEETLRAVREGILMDVTACCQQMIMLQSLCMRRLREKQLDKPARMGGTPRSPLGGQPPAAEELTEERLLELERQAYARDPLVDCYNHALDLAGAGHRDRAYQLHAALYDHFSEFPVGDPVLILMNLIAYAAGKDDPDERLAVLMTIDDAVREEAAGSGVRGSRQLFRYWYMAAACCQELADHAVSDDFFARADALRRYATADLEEFDGMWAVCKRMLGDMETAESLMLSALDRLMFMKDKPVDIWNRLCREYACLLEQMGKDEEAEAWLQEVLPEG